jgi:hypothetical protein
MKLMSYTAVHGDRSTPSINKSQRIFIHTKRINKDSAQCSSIVKSMRKYLTMDTPG